MTWTKLGDEFSDATADLSDAAVRTHVDALVWSNRRLLDLKIPKRDLRKFAESAEADAAVVELLDAGWWQDCDPVYFIGCMFPDWQVEKAVVEHKRAVSAETTRRNRLHKAGDHALCVPGRCTALRDTASDTSRDTGTDASGDASLRDGSGRVGTGKNHPLDEEEQQAYAREASSSNHCSVCGAEASFSLLDGKCRRCAFDGRRSA